MIRTVIVDDEPPARELLREFLRADDDVEIVAECANGFEAVKAVAEHDPDLLLLDIQMPKLDGFEVLELLDRSPLVVFATAHDEYALRAFEVHALDYRWRGWPRRCGPSRCSASWCAATTARSRSFPSLASTTSKPPTTQS